MLDNKDQSVLIVGCTPGGEVCYACLPCSFVDL